MNRRPIRWISDRSIFYILTSPKVLSLHSPIYLLRSDRLPNVSIPVYPFVIEAGSVFHVTKVNFDHLYSMSADSAHEYIYWDSCSIVDLNAFNVSLVFYLNLTLSINFRFVI